MSLASWAQQSAELKVEIDTTNLLIGEQLNYTLQIKADSSSQVVFPEQPIFAPFELLEESPIDTLRAESHYLYTKKYALIQFDSGNYFLPQQQVLVDGFSKIAELIQIRVNPVDVDTAQQKLYNIKHSITRNSFANSRKFILNKINNRRLTNSQYMNILKYFNKNNLRCISI